MERDTGIQHDLWRSPLLASSGIQGWTGTRNLLHLGEMFVASESRDQGLACGRMSWGCGGEVDVIVSSETEGKEQGNPISPITYVFSDQTKTLKNEGVVVVPEGFELFVVGVKMKMVSNTCPSVHPFWMIQALFTSQVHTSSLADESVPAVPF